MNCIHCGKPIVLTPTAQERARKYGNTPAYYTSLFTEHAQCAIDSRAQGDRELLRARASQTGKQK